jgi:quercetin dioxygenase-like cupin family protein
MKGPHGRVPVFPSVRKRRRITARLLDLARRSSLRLAPHTPPPGAEQKPADAGDVLCASREAAEAGHRQSAGHIRRFDQCGGVGFALAVLEPGTVVTSPRGTRVEVLENTSDRFTVGRTLPPRTGKTAAHRHMNAVERFELLEGEATAAVEGKARALAPGDVLEVPVGSSHVHPHAVGATATILHTVEPRTKFVEVYFASWLGWLEQGATDAQDEPTLLQIMAVIKEGGGGSWVSGPPVFLQKGLAQVLGRVAALRGFRAAGMSG